MTTPDTFFAEFPPVSKADWLAKIAKDLKDKPIDSLYWQLSETIKVDPFGHPDDQSTPPAPLLDDSGEWAISETVDASDPNANAIALEALAGGAESLQFDLPVSEFSIEDLLKGIHTDFVGLHFSGPGVTAIPGAVMAGLQEAAGTALIPSTALRGSLDFDPAAASGLKDYRYLADLVLHAADYFPQFRVITVHSPSVYGGPGGIPAKLQHLLQQCNLYLKELAARDVDPAQAAASIEISFSIGPDYFTELSALRAFKILWMNLLKAWGVAPSLPSVSVQFYPETYTADLYTNMIRATTMAMSGILGGARRLTVLPYDAGREDLSAYPQAFSRRIARNVQHLLKMESLLAEVNDPAAGSYYIENLTKQLAEETWDNWRKLG